MKSEPIWIDKKVPFARSAGVVALLGVSRETISTLVKEGMPCENPKERMRIYNLQKVLKWEVDRKVEKTMKSMQHFEDSLDDDFKTMPMDQLNRAMKVWAAKKLKHEAVIKEIQENAEKGRYIPADRVDQNMAEIVKILIVILKELRVLLPMRLSDKNEKEIEEILDSQFEDLFVKLKTEAENV